MEFIELPHGRYVSPPFSTVGQALTCYIRARTSRPLAEKVPVESLLHMPALAAQQSHHCQQEGGQKQHLFRRPFHLGTLFRARPRRLPTSCPSFLCRPARGRRLSYSAADGR